MVIEESAYKKAAAARQGHYGVLVVCGVNYARRPLFGVRVSEVTDEAARATPGGPERVWGYGYRTLEGHFERGQIDFTIHKNLTTGAVQFRIHAVSQPGQIRNPFYWLGFKLFGRMLQRKFARESLRRMRELVAAQLAGQPLPQTLNAPAGSISS